MSKVNKIQEAYAHLVVTMMDYESHKPSSPEQLRRVLDCAGQLFDTVNYEYNAAMFDSLGTQAAPAADPDMDIIAEMRARKAAESKPAPQEPGQVPVIDAIRARRKRP